MITAEDILNMNFYKKEKFTGSYKGMRYLVKKKKMTLKTIFSAPPSGLDLIIFQPLPTIRKFPPLFHSQKKADSRQSTG